MAAPKTKKVKFKKSPTGAYNLAYSAGDEATLSAQQAKEVVEDDYAEYVKK